MPRRHSRARERGGPPLPAAKPFPVAPEWAVVPGVTVRSVQGSKPYICPGCNQAIRPRTPHLVVVESDDVQSRRHWHTPCWRRELRRRGLAT
jgi:hypothetical protein